MPWIPVASKEAIPIGSALAVEVGAREVALFHLPDGVYATSNVCPHQGGPLSEGQIDGEIVVCPWHQWRFDIKTGCAVGRSKLKIDTYPVLEEAETLSLLFPE